MSSDNIVEPLAPSNIGLASAAMARAFLEYPILTWLIPDVKERTRFVYPYARRALEYGFRYGKVYSDVSISSAVIYLPPDKTVITLGRLVRSGFVFAPFRLGLSKAVRFIAFNTAADKVHRAHLANPHWYFFMIGVDPTRQSTGIGAALIEKGLQLADAQRLPCYLETHVASNVRYLEKYGFHLIEETEFFKGAPHNWAMIRYPIQ